MYYHIEKYNEDYCMCRHVNVNKGNYIYIKNSTYMKYFNIDDENGRITAKISDIQAYSFAAYDMLLYLDTHPNDKKAFRLFKDLVSKTNTLKAYSSFS